MSTGPLELAQSSLVTIQASVQLRVPSGSSASRPRAVSPVAWPEVDVTLWLQDLELAVPLIKVGLAEDGVVELPEVAGLWRPGGHRLVTPLRTLPAGPVLLWEADGLSWRLEGPFTLTEATAIAQKLAML